MFRRKTIEPVQCAGGIKCFGVQLNRSMRGVDSRTTTRCFFCMSGVRRTVRSQEEAGVTARNCIQQGEAIRLRLQHGQTVVVRAYPAGVGVVGGLVAEADAGPLAVFGDAALSRFGGASV